MPRLAPLAYEDMTLEQKRVHDDVVSGPRGRVVGPINAWFRNPALCDRAQKLGAFCRFESGIDARLREFVILIVARRWSAQIEWWAHHPLAINAGLNEKIAAAIMAGRRPDFVNRDEEIVYDFCNELLDTHRVRDDAYATMIETFGETLTVEFVALLGYYTSVAMILNTFQEYPPDGSMPFGER
jgi:4-carboxymuconolactone decarboxylase